MKSEPNDEMVNNGSNGNPWICLAYLSLTHRRQPVYQFRAGNLLICSLSEKRGESYSLSEKHPKSSPHHPTPTTIVLFIHEIF